MYTSVGLAPGGVALAEQELSRQLVCTNKARKMVSLAAAFVVAPPPRPVHDRLCVPQACTRGAANGQPRP